MDGSGDETGFPRQNPGTIRPNPETMKRMIMHIAPWLAAAAIGGALVFAPVASADSSADPGPHAAPSPSQSQGAPTPGGADPLTPYGSDLSTDEPYGPYINPGVA
jgi:hypothetical protein